MNKYFVNMDSTKNPNNNHEVHNTSCVFGKRVPLCRRIDLGYQVSGTAAVEAAKQYYADADGGLCCCSNAHME